MEVLSDEFKTRDGLCLGDSKEKVRAALGIPYMESVDEFRYRNTEFEVVGIIFQFREGKVSKIVLFSYV